MGPGGCVLVDDVGGRWVVVVRGDTHVCEMSPCWHEVVALEQEAASRDEELVEWPWHTERCQDAHRLYDVLPQPYNPSLTPILHPLPINTRLKT